MSSIMSEPRRGVENSMWDELILPPFILRLVQRCFVISASVHTECSGSIHLTGRGERKERWTIKVWPKRGKR